MKDEIVDCPHCGKKVRIVLSASGTLTGWKEYNRIVAVEKA